MGESAPNEWCAVEHPGDISDAIANRLPDAIEDARRFYKEEPHLVSELSYEDDRTEFSVEHIEGVEPTDEAGRFRVFIREHKGATALTVVASGAAIIACAASIHHHRKKK